MFIGINNMSNRIKTAIEFLKDNQSFLVDDLRLSVNQADDIEVTGWSQYTNLKNLTKAKSLEELEEIKILFLNMREDSPELEIFLKERNVIFNLWFDDYGKASIEICSEKNDVVYWLLDLE
jgi:hypothetical protein